VSSEAVWPPRDHRRTDLPAIGQRIVDFGFVRRSRTGIAACDEKPSIAENYGCVLAARRSRRRPAKTRHLYPTGNRRERAADPAPPQSKSRRLEEAAAASKGTRLANLGAAELLRTIPAAKEQKKCQQHF
jgi:hypothetical protein